MNILSVNRCEVCAVVLLNVNPKEKYCATHKIAMKEWARTRRFLCSDVFKAMTWEYKRKLLFIINNPNHKDAIA